MFVPQNAHNTSGCDWNLQFTSFYCIFCLIHAIFSIWCFSILVLWYLVFDATIAVLTRCIFTKLRAIETCNSVNLSKKNNGLGEGIKWSWMQLLPLNHLINWNCATRNPSKSDAMEKGGLTDNFWGVSTLSVKTEWQQVGGWAGGLQRVWRMWGGYQKFHSTAPLTMAGTTINSAIKKELNWRTCTAHHIQLYTTRKYSAAKSMRSSL